LQLKTNSQQYLDDLYEDYGETYYNGKNARWYRLEGVSPLEIKVLTKETDGCFDDGFKLFRVEWQDYGEDSRETCFVRLMRDC
jgi:hypothetical protein